jgi:hypothetical protein
VKRPRLLASLVFAVFLAGLARDARAQNNPTITLPENGQGTLVFPGGGTFQLAGVLAPDPGPGGLPSALTYNLLGPPSLVAGDVFLFENGIGISDIIRFNPAGTGSPGYAASVVFYSLSGGAGQTELADTGFPTAFYTNNLVLVENTSGPTTYTPTSTQPGFISGFSVTYNLISAVPEPSTISILLAGAIVGGLATRRRR